MVNIKKQAVRYTLSPKAIGKAIIAGAIYTDQWKHKANIIQDPTCTHCSNKTNSAIDSHERRLDRVPRMGIHSKTDVIYLTN